MSQTHVWSSTCVLAIAAGLNTNKNKSNFDFQEDYIKDKLKKKLGTLVTGKEAQGGDDTIALVTRNMYDLVWDLIKIEVDSVTSKADFWKNSNEVTLLGGYIINRSVLGVGKTTFNLSPWNPWIPKGSLVSTTKSLGI